MADRIATSEDRLLGGRLRLLQPRKGYRAAIDPVFLAAATMPAATMRVLDLGCGAGAASLCLARRVTGVSVIGVDIQADLVDLARRNAMLNGLAGRVRFHAGDLLAPPAAVAAGGFDHVIANPPFHPAGRVTPPADPAARLAMVEGKARLADWLRSMAALAGRRGVLTLIHHAGRLAEILRGLATCQDPGSPGGDITVFPLWPRPGRPASRVILRLRRGGAATTTWRPGLVLHDETGSYTRAARRILWDGAALNDFMPS